VVIITEGGPPQAPSKAEVEVLIYADRSQPFAQVADSLATAVASQLQRAGEAAPRSEVTTGHYLPQGSPCVFPLTLQYTLETTMVEGRVVRAAGQEDGEELKLRRAGMHSRLGLPLNRPAFRTACALSLAPAAGEAEVSA
jgi:hypothetical protein